MSTPRQILAAIFDMDGLLIDSEPLWDRAELDVIASLGVDITRRHELPDTLGLRIDMVVDLWFAQQPWNGPDRQEVTNRVIARAITLIEETRPLLPGVREAVALCKAQGLLVGLASASPLHMLEKVPYSKPHPQVYLDCAAKLGVDPLTCVALEDSVNGLIAAKAARMRAIVVPAEENQHDPRFALANVKLNSLTGLTATHLLG
ncbi:hexitol phosphatase HxpB [Salmonella enterica]|nr:hexitol phosphatase HxpB [Salmonella enterica]EDR4377942.1 hexitol phosphatase HxpB [Salmonella enterica]EEG5735050.1 hexitol phosphatase HxpB [Salmonella enterica]EEG6158909.1 hexitol phosphatase HxpB [Salmonella enterica]EEH7435243.1 hexitol phosphatase HxpB [Salmonella enterica]